MNIVELYIEGKQAVLPEKLSLQMIESNPLIDRRGDYTFEIYLSLEKRENILIFGTIDRKNQIVLKKRYDATLYYNFKQYTGRVLVLGNTDKSVKLQFLGNNSYVNSAEIMKKKVWELDWGEVSTLDFYNKIANDQY